MLLSCTTIRKEYGEIIIGTNNDSGGQESNKAIHKLCQNLPVKLIDQYPEQNDWNDKLKYVIGHGYRSNYIAESKDITDALEGPIRCHDDVRSGFPEVGMYEFFR